MSRFIVCYDIADDGRRLKIARTLDAYGDRIQASVFELPVDARRMQACLQAVLDILDPKTDGLAVYPLCAGCDGKTAYFGASRKEPRIGEESVFIV